jgi:hypothetical protein
VPDRRALRHFEKIEHPLRGDALDTVVANLTVQRNAVAGSVKGAAIDETFCTKPSFASV